MDRRNGGETVNEDKRGRYGRKRERREKEISRKRGREWESEQQVNKLN